MVHGSLRRLAPLVVLAATAAAEEPAIPEFPGLRESQVTIHMENAAGQSRFRGTVVDKAEGRLTIVTAGHAMGPEDAGDPVRIVQRGVTLRGHVVRVARNPIYRPPPAPDLPGADNALAVIDVGAPEGDAAELFEALRIVEVTPSPVPDPDGQTIAMVTIDQFETRHIFRAGNYSNPRWLEWGQAYHPIEGDSGSGAFVIRLGADGKPRPVLIGVVVVRSRQGGGASLISRSQRWLVAAAREGDRHGPSGPAAGGGH